MLVDTLLEVVRRFWLLVAIAVHSRHVHPPVPFDGFVLALLFEAQLVDAVLLSDLVEVLVSSEGHGPQLVVVPLLIVDGLNVGKLLASHLHLVFSSTVCADHDAQPQHDVSRLILQAADTELVEWILEDLLEEVDYDWWLI